MEHGGFIIHALTTEILLLQVSTEVLITQNDMESSVGRERDIPSKVVNEIVSIVARPSGSGVGLDVGEADATLALFPAFAVMDMLFPTFDVLFPAFEGVLDGEPDGESDGACDSVGVGGASS
jgi:hypothetical protein